MQSGGWLIHQEVDFGTQNPYNDIMPKGIKGFQKGHTINIGRVFTTEQKMHMKLAQKGKVISKETREKIALTKAGKKYPNSWKGKTIKCPVCGTEKYKYPRDIKRVQTNFCSKKCAYRYRDEGMTSLQERVRDSLNYSQWRESVLRRDSFTCRHCGKMGRSLHADHIEAFGLLLRKHNIMDIQSALVCADLWKLENGQTLCASCHWKTDNYGYKAWQQIKQSKYYDAKPK